VRDIDVLLALAGQASVSVALSIPTLDEHVWRTTEPGTSPPRQRLRAVERLAAAGVRVGVAMAPLLPGLSDSPEALAATARAAKDSGALFLWGRALYLPPGTREHFLEALARDWPDEVERYEALYAYGDYLRRSDSEPLAAVADALRVRFGFAERGPVGGGREEPVQLALISQGGSRGTNA
jgi:DNA repair photolyase